MNELFSVDGGKYHRPSQPTERDKAWKPTKTACGITVVPLNYFASEDDANRHTGGRLDQHLCKHCKQPTA